MSDVGRSGRRSWNGSSDEELKKEAVIDLLRLMVSTEVRSTPDTVARLQSYTWHKVAIMLLLMYCGLSVCYYYYAAFNAPCVGHKDDESQAQIGYS